ncbi:MAG: dihydrodipicolinate synthase family protein [Symbiobacteriia bacterium]
MTTKGRMKGIFPAVFTPFTADGNRVDEAALRAHVEWLIEKGVHGLFVCGTNGEGPLLSTAEHDLVARAAAEQAKGRVPVLVQSGAMTTDGAVELLQNARAAGADGAAVVTPWYFTYDDESLYQHYRAVAAAAPDFPIFIYNIPGYARNDVKPSLAGRLADSTPNIIGVKDSSKDLDKTDAFIAALGPNRPVFVGTDSMVLPALSMGAAGGVAGIANVFPEPMVGIYEAYRAGELEEARRLQYLVTSIRTAMKGPAGMMLYKKALELRGLKAGGPRRPARPVTPAEEARLQADLAQLGVLA